MNRRTVSLPRILLHIPATAIPSVVVRIPPAVEEGAEPINIRIEKIKMVVGERSPSRIVENPALRVENELKKSAIDLSVVEPYIGLFQKV